MQSAEEIEEMFAGELSTKDALDILKKVLEAERISSLSYPMKYRRDDPVNVANIFFYSDDRKVLQFIVDNFSENGATKDWTEEDIAHFPAWKRALLAEWPAQTVSFVLERGFERPKTVITFSTGDPASTYNEEDDEFLSEFAQDRLYIGDKEE